MNQLATITSKRQLTIPASIYYYLNLKKGQRVLVGVKKKKIIIQPAADSVEELAGSVSLPTRFKRKNVNQIIKLAKKEYFRNKK
ncbi:AbrB/MazE/SpoVT family DNA-binding domain-containing protein [Candidatus Shapirobacteria bacterium]|nr:AbrB/MazE/SpoVT family DNA-binding domain-containing protein [Candidatus Shapirobacteria bacterium]